MLNIKVSVVFVCGFVLGALVAILLSVIQQKNQIQRSETLPNNIYEKWFSKQKLQRYPISFDTLRYSGHHYFTESKYLFNKIKFACLVLIRKVKYVKGVKLTWATQCDHVELVYLKPNKTKLSFRKDITSSSWFLLCKALGKLPNSYHWILVINENTFAIMENIRFLVASLNYSSQYYLGHSMKFWGVRYNSGQAGYVLSNGSLAALKKKIGNDSCSADVVFWNLEDYYLGRSLAVLNISTSDTRDEHGLAVFHGFNLQKLFSPGSISLTNYYKYSTYPAICCSSRSATFQVQGIHSMFTYQYLLHQLQIFTSGTYGNIMATTPVPEEEVWKSILREHGRNYTNISADEYYEFWVDLVSDPSSFLLKLKNDN